MTALDDAYKCVFPGLSAFRTVFSGGESLPAVWERNAERTEDKERINRDGNGAER